MYELMLGAVFKKLNRAFKSVALSITGIVIIYGSETIK